MSEDSNEVEIGRLAGLVEGLSSAIKHFDKIVYGNGQPGMIDRMTRIEETVLDMDTHFTELRDMVSDLADSVKLLKCSIDDHIKDDKKHTVKGLFLTKEVVPWIILVFMLLHEIAPNFSLLDLAKKLFGVP